MCSNHQISHLPTGYRPTCMLEMPTARTPKTEVSSCGRNQASTSVHHSVNSDSRFHGHCIWDTKGTGVIKTWRVWNGVLTLTDTLQREMPFSMVGLSAGMSVSHHSSSLALQYNLLMRTLCRGEFACNHVELSLGVQHVRGVTVSTQPLHHRDSCTLQPPLGEGPARNAYRIL